jgi:hypothetical protein
MKYHKYPQITMKSHKYNENAMNIHYYQLISFVCWLM